VIDGFLDALLTAGVFIVLFLAAVGIDSLINRNSGNRRWPPD
jgi:hypothetical protein